jgi:chromosome segregation protein
VAERTGAQAEAATRQATTAAELPALREAEAKAASGLQRLNIARENLEKEETRAKERITELDRRIIQLGHDIERERRLAADAQAALGRLAAEEEILRQEAQASAERQTGVDQRAGEAGAELATVENTFAELTSALADLIARRNQLKTAARGHAERTTRLQSEIAQLETELAQLQTGSPGGPDMVALAVEVNNVQTSLADAEIVYQDAEGEHAAARQGLEAARTPLAEAERRVQRLETEAKTIAKFLSVETKNLWPPVMDSITVEKGYEKALGTALGDDLDAPTDSSAPMRWAGAPLDATDPPLPAGLDPLAKYVTAPAELARRLAQIGLVERTDGARLAKALNPGQRLVSREGDLWRWDGFAAAAHAPTGAARRLAERGRLSHIEGELQAARAEVDVHRRTVELAQVNAGQAATAESEARTAWRERQREADEARDHHAAAEREAGRHAARISALAEAKIRLCTDRDETISAQRQAEEALIGMPPAAALEAELAALRDEIEGHRARVAEVRAEAQALAREAELSDRRLQAIAAERNEWQTRSDGAAAQIATLETRSGEARAERDKLAQAPQIFAEKRTALITEIGAAEAGRRGAADRLAAAENALAEADRAARAALEAMGTAREDAARAEERFGGAQRRLADVGHEIKEMLEVEPAELAALAGVQPGTALPDVAEVEANLDKLRRDRERLGAVNLRAEEELRDVETQHTGLATERDDLVEAIKRLRQGIQSLNREARERLLASFEVVSGHFRHLFTELFGGGTAELQLIEHDDPLEAGLEIVAKPPGKKPTTLSLLSGGEQALTALALIFAVFLTNPAPICVLDEVDAPLDDHNVERFCDLLDEMTKSTDTRFVIITHNPITMARMNRLFGVTMAERGVSQLVSVDLESAVKLREAV